MEQFGSEAHFVGLQMSDQMKACVGQFEQIRLFLCELLNVVFAEFAQTGLIGFTNPLSREFLGNCH